MAYGADTKLGTLLDDPKARDVLVAHLPEISSMGPMLSMGRGMSLKSIAAFPQAKLPQDKLAALVADLERL